MYAYQESVPLNTTCGTTSVTVSVTLSESGGLPYISFSWPGGVAPTVCGQSISMEVYVCSIITCPYDTGVVADVVVPGTATIPATSSSGWYLKFFANGNQCPVGGCQHGWITEVNAIPAVSCSAGGEACYIVGAWFSPNPVMPGQQTTLYVDVWEQTGNPYYSYTASASAILPWNTSQALSMKRIGTSYGGLGIIGHSFAITVTVPSDICGGSVMSAEVEAWLNVLGSPAAYAFPSLALSGTGMRVVSASFSPSSVNSGGSTVLSVSTSCAASSATATLPWNGQVVSLGGSGTSWSVPVTAPNVSSTYTYSVSVQAVSMTGQTATGSAGLTVWALSISSAYFRPAQVEHGQQATLVVTTSSPASSVTARLPWNGQTVNLSGGGTSWSLSVTAPALPNGADSQTYTVTVTATGASGGSASASAQLTVVAPPGISSASFSPSAVKTGGSTTLVVRTYGMVVSVQAVLPWNNQTVTLSGGGSNWTASVTAPVLPTGVNSRNYTVSVTALGPTGDKATGSARLVVWQVLTSGGSVSPGSGDAGSGASAETGPGTGGSRLVR